MTDNFHTNYENGVTSWSDADMNIPLKELDAGISALFQGGFVTVKDKDLSAPPGSPAALDTYVVAAGASGAWAGQEGKLTVYFAAVNEWKFIAMIEGLTLYVQDENTEYQYNGSALVKKHPYIVAGFYPGVLENDALCVRHVMVFAVDFPANLSGSFSKAGIAATAETVFSVKKNGTEFGTITFAISGAVGTLAATATSFAAGDILTVVGPASADASLADVDFSLKGLR